MVHLSMKNTTWSPEACNRAASDTNPCTKRRVLKLGIRNFLEAGDFKAFTTTFEDLHGLAQLPGLAVPTVDGRWLWLWCRRGLENGRAAACHEGDGRGHRRRRFLHGRLHLPLQSPTATRSGSHMLEICDPCSCRRKTVTGNLPLSIGGKADPVRLIFDSQTGPAIGASIIDMGNRFRMVANLVEVVPTDEPLPNLPVARALWMPRPNLKWRRQPGFTRVGHITPASAIA